MRPTSAKRYWSGVAVALLLTACDTGSPDVDAGPTSAPRPAPSTPACPDSGVSVTVGLDEAATGVRVLGIVLTNCGDRPYDVHGYPAVRVLDENREPLAVEIGEGSAGIATVEAFDTAPTRVTLRPGDTALSGLLWRNAVTDVTVPSVVGSHLEVSPAPGRPRQEVDPPEGEDAVTIDLGTTRTLGVRPWTS